MKASKALSIKLNNDEIKAINDTKHIIKDLIEECENEFPVEDYVIDIENGWVVLDEGELSVLKHCLEALSGISDIVVMEVK